MKILQVYSQEMQHSEARIIGNEIGLLELRNTIDKAIKQGKASTSPDKDCVFANDGEGYELIVECHNDEWGMNAPKDSYWNKPESEPEYIMYQNNSEG
jgi:hypothetical protein